MSKPCSTLPNPVESNANFVSALAQIGAEIDHQPLRSSALARIMRETFHGSDASGAWDWRMAYDLMQAAAVQMLLRGDGAAGDIATAKLLGSRLLTETRRSEQQIRLQQFSTPLPFAALVVRAAAIRKGETVLEPSAGTGALAAFAARAGAMLLLNEIDPFRQRLLRAVFGREVTGHDGDRASGRAALISARPMQMYDEDIVTLMRKAVRPNGSSYLEETRFESSAWEEIGKPEFVRLWDEEAASLPKTATTKLYLLTGLLLPIWKDIPTTNERIYRVTPDGATAMIGRTLSEEGAAALRARFLVSNPQTPQEMLTAALGTTAPLDLGRGLTLTRRRVAGEMRLELGGADKGMIDGLKALGCFTEIIAFQLRVFLPHGDGIDTGDILIRIVGQGLAITADQAA